MEALVLQALELLDDVLQWAEDDCDEDDRHQLDVFQRRRDKLVSRFDATGDYAPVGMTVWNAYWGEFYDVLSHNDDGSVTIRWHGSPERGTQERVATHRTAMDRSRDKIIGPAV